MKKEKSFKGDQVINCHPKLSTKNFRKISILRTKIYLNIRIQTKLLKKCMKELTNSMKKLKLEINILKN